MASLLSRRHLLPAGPIERPTQAVGAAHGRPADRQEKLRWYESAQLRGLHNPLPTRTPISEAIAAEDEFSVCGSGSTDLTKREHRFKGSACETGSIPL